jgi:hypothetical protein
MFGLDMLDVAIGIAFVYLLISLLCSAIVEGAEAVLKRRSSDLERGIGELLHDPSLLSRLYNHPLINGLFKGTYKPGMRNLPSYIPSRSFSLAIMDLLISPDASRHQGVAGAAGPRTGAVSTTALVDGMTDDPLADQARHAVLTLVNAAAGDAQKARENIEFWFDTAMDRVSGGYKRRAQRALFIIGLLVAIGMNIDTVRILRELMTNKSKREAVVAIASSYAAKQPPADVNDQFNATTKELESLGLPLGWPSCRKCDQRKMKIVDVCWQDCWMRNVHSAGGLTIFGWLLTAFAVCLGGPFWFDLLNKFIVVRSTVKPREKSGTEGSKEPQAPAPPAAS